MTDFTKLLDRLEPPQDGESPVRHRTGTVSAVNTDGTVDLDLGGVVVDSVAVLAGAFIAVGATVQVAVWRGDLLVLGAARTANQGGPLGVLGYAEVTTSQGSITTETDLTGLSVTVDVAANRRVKISGRILVRSDTADDVVRLRVKESTTSLQHGQMVTGNRLNTDQSFTVEVIRTPSSGSHTYNLSLEVVVGGGTASARAGATFPAFILVEDLGPA